MLQPFEKGKSFVEQAVPVAELLKKISGVLKEVDGLKKRIGDKSWCGAATSVNISINMVGVSSKAQSWMLNTGERQQPGVQANEEGPEAKHNDCEYEHTNRARYHYGGTWERLASPGAILTLTLLRGVDFGE
jgi:hypothetical protein